MEIEKEFHLQPADIKAFYFRSNLPSFIAWGVLMVLPVIWALFMKNVMILVISAIALLYMIYLLVRVMRSYKQSVTGDQHLLQPLKIQTDAAGFTMSSGDKTGAKVAFMRMHSVVGTKRIIIFRVTARSTMLLPREAFTKEEQHFLTVTVGEKIKEGKRLRRTAKRTK